MTRRSRRRDPGRDVADVYAGAGTGIAAAAIVLGYVLAGAAVGTYGAVGVLLGWSAGYLAREHVPGPTVVRVRVILRIPPE